MGPNLFGVGGRMAGSQPGFAYSAAMRASGFHWDRDRLLAFVMQPRATVPGTGMPFAGIQDRAQAQAVVDYLLTLR